MLKALFRGLVILIPVILIYIALRELLQLMVDMATPIADLFPAGTFDHEKETEILAFLLIVGTSVALGLLAHVKPVRVVATWLEARVLERIPMYSVMKSLVAAFLNRGQDHSFKPALLDSGNGNREPVYIIEESGNGMTIVMSPWTPTAFAGSVKIVKSEYLEPLPVTLDEFSLAVTHFGVGMTKILNTTPTSTAQQDRAE